MNLSWESILLTISHAVVCSLCPLKGHLPFLNPHFRTANLITIFQTVGGYPHAMDNI